MRRSVTLSRAAQGDPAPAPEAARRADRRLERRAILALIPVSPAVGLLRRSSAALLAEPRRPPGSGRAHRFPALAIPAESRLVFRGGSVRAG